MVQEIKNIMNTIGKNQSIELRTFKYLFFDTENIKRWKGVFKNV